MASAIAAIYTAIAGWSVSVGSTTPGVRNTDKLKDTLNPSDVPTRMMLVTTGDTEVINAIFKGLGKTQEITWAIEDRLYWRPVASGQGLADFSHDLILYIAAYLEKARSDRSPTTQSYIEGCRVIPAIVRWPDFEGGTPYAGVRCILTVREVVSGA